MAVLDLSGGAGINVILERCELDGQLAADLLRCAGPGEHSEDVALILWAHTVEVTVSEARAYLKGYGAWDEEELDDYSRNVERLVWLAGCDLEENGYIAFES